MRGFRNLKRDPSSELYCEIVCGTVYRFESTLIVFFSRGVIRPHVLSIMLFSANYAK